MIALVTGGASCGKSAFAEELCMTLGGNLIYLAAMRPFGEEGARRVRKHRAQRAGKGFTTIECYERFGAVLDDGRIDGATVLLECMGNVVANELFDGEAVDAKPANVDETVDRIVETVEALRHRCCHFVVVGNEVGDDGVTYPSETRTYQEVLGSVQQKVAMLSDRVVECAAGVSLDLKVE